MVQNRTLFLMYHELELPNRNLCNIENGYTRYVLQQSDFYQQIALLSQHGYRGSSVSECLNPNNQSNKPIGITFDDGCETDLIAAAPILKEFHFNGTFYIVVENIGKPGYLNPSQLCELSNQGFEIGSHSMTHRFLSDLSHKEQYFELHQSKFEIEQILGQPIHHFSCPGGRWNLTSAQIAQDVGYLSMATSQIGTVDPISSRYSLARMPILRNTSINEIQQIFLGKGMLTRKAREKSFRIAKSLLGNNLYERVRSKILSQ